ncbi:hypothetical protein NpPPO83_00000273 [Neofusicoccum parvum]|uniref:Uncharacterized protein n=1 Tax=Neofusicoccum parvum TaxID=310453 RepID=A0ACB5SDD5_9PEZI|nr:hypothetical protein NpPPO83_00000273 [Neofusicoccum parvum]
MFPGIQEAYIKMTFDYTQDPNSFYVESLTDTFGLYNAIPLSSWSLQVFVRAVARANTRISLKKLFLDDERSDTGFDFDAEVPLPIEDYGGVLDGLEEVGMNFPDESFLDTVKYQRVLWILKRASNIKAFTLKMSRGLETGASDAPAPAFRFLAGRIHIPRLEELTLGFIDVTYDSVEKLLRNHATTLRKVTIYNCRMFRDDEVLDMSSSQAGAGVIDWADWFSDPGRKSRLKLKLEAGYPKLAMPEPDRSRYTFTEYPGIEEYEGDDSDEGGGYEESDEEDSGDDSMDDTSMGDGDSSSGHDSMEEDDSSEDDREH